MADVTFEGFNGSGGGSGASLVFATVRDIQPGERVIVYAGERWSSQKPLSSVSVGALALTRDLDVNSSNDAEWWSFQATALIPAGSSVTVTPPGVTAQMVAVCFSLGNVDNASPVRDTGTHGNSSGVGPTTGSTGSAPQPGDMAIGGLTVGSSSSAVKGAGGAATFISSARETGTGTQGAAEYQAVAAAGPVSLSFDTGTVSVTYTAGLVVYAAASAGAQTLLSGRIASGAAARGGALAGVLAALAPGRIGSSATARGGSLRGMLATFASGRVASGAGVRGGALVSLAARILSGHVSSTSALRGGAATGIGAAPLRSGRIASGAAVRGGLARGLLALLESGRIGSASVVRGGRVGVRVIAGLILAAVLRRPMTLAATERELTLTAAKARTIELEAVIQ